MIMRRAGEPRRNRRDGKWRVGRLSLVFVLGCCLGTGAAHAQQPPVFDVSTGVVRVDVVVTRDGRPVTGLGKEAFELRENGEPQQIQVIPGRDLPVQAILVLDTSGSVAGERLDQLKTAGRMFLDGLADKDCAALVSFSYDARLRTGSCTDRDTARLALTQLQALTTTNLYDAVYAALTLVEPREGRPVLVVLSDGADNTSWLRPQEVLSVARNTDATVYAVAFAKQQSEPQVEALGELARETGGRLWLVGGDVDMSTAFGGVLEELRNRYILGYEPRSARPGWHKLDVRLRVIEGDIRARSGYSAER